MAYIPGKMLVHGFFIFACLARLAVSNELIETYFNGTTVVLEREVRNETRKITFQINNYDLITRGDSEDFDTFLREIVEELYEKLQAILEPSSTSTVATRITTQPTSTSTTLASTQYTTTSTTLETTQTTTTSSTLTTATPITLVTTQIVTSSTTFFPLTNVTSPSATTVSSDATSPSATTVSSDATSPSATTVSSDVTSPSATTVSSDVTSASATTVSSDVTSASATTISSDATTEATKLITTKLTSSDTPPTTTLTTAYNSTSTTTQVTTSTKERETTDSVTTHVTEPSTISGETSATTFNTSSTSTLSTTQLPVMTSYLPVTTVSETPITTSTQPPTTIPSQPPATTVTQISVTTPSQHSTTAFTQSPTNVSRSPTQATPTSPGSPHQPTSPGSPHQPTSPGSPHQATTAEPDKALRLASLLDEVKDSAKLTVAEVKNYTTEVIGFNKYMLKDYEIAKKVVTVVGCLSSVNLSVSLQAETENQTNTRLREFLDNYTMDINPEKNGGLVNVSTSEIEIIVISTLYLNMTLLNGTITFPTIAHENEQNVTLILPTNIFTEGDKETKIYYIGYKRSQLFVPQNGFSREIPSLDRQRVISASVKEKKVSNLTTPVEIHLPKIQPGRKHTCVFWDIKRSEWSTEGVTLVSDDFDSQICHSSHLTSFSLLMNVGTEVEDKVLTFLTYIGCGVSIVCLFMTIVTYSIFRCLNKEKAGKVLLSLCVALLLLNVTFLAATVDVSSYNEISCVAAGMLLHYFLLAAMTWMLVEAVALYQALVTVFKKYERHYMIKRCLLAWGTPAIIVAVTAALSRQSYSMNQHDRKFCFLTNSNTAVFFGSVIGPCSLIMLANIFVFIIVTRVIFRENFQQKIRRRPSSVTPTQIRGMFSVMFLLGVTWVFGPLAIEDAQIVFSYLFCICNSLQGFFIFVFRCFSNSEARLAWLQLLRTGTLKRRRGPFTPLATDTSKSGDRRHSNNTTNTVTSTSDGSHSEPQETTNKHDSDLNSFSQEQKKSTANDCRFYRKFFGNFTNKFQLTPESLNVGCVGSYKPSNNFVRNSKGQDESAENNKQFNDPLENKKQRNDSYSALNNDSMVNTHSKDFVANTLMADSDTNYENTSTHF